MSITPTVAVMGKAFRMTGLILISLAILCLAAAPRFAQATESDWDFFEQDQGRVALIIGNSNYTDSPLKNPVNDAQLMAATLTDIGFDVTVLVDLDQGEMKRAIRDFGVRLQLAGGVGLFYFAGHGMQVEGRNYLIPVNAPITHEDDVDIEAVDANYVLAQMSKAGNSEREGVNIVILDACRNNPFERSFRSGAGGLAFMDAPSGTLIGYATSPGKVAADGEGENGLYTGALVEAMRVPGQSVESVFKAVRSKVQKKSDGKQVPWESTSLTNDFSFIPDPAEEREISAVQTPVPAGTASTVDPLAVDLAFWSSIKDSTNPAGFQSYLRKYPEGEFAPLAELKLQEMGAPLQPENDAQVAALPGSGTRALTTDAVTSDVHECDLYAADPRDPARRSEGVSLRDMDAIAAVAACEIAVEDNPDDIHFRLQLARGLFAKRDKEAFPDALIAAAEVGHPLAQADVGMFSWQGRNGFKKDFKMAAKWLAKASESGHPQSMATLGALYELGDGVKRDYAYAATLYSYAVKNGFPAAQQYFDAILPQATQQRLLQLGYRIGRVDGKFGRKSQAALKNFQKQAKMPITGTPSLTTFERLDLTVRQRAAQ
ncbi:MAG: caspase family protein [Pseudomonadota bacterium]